MASFPIHIYFEIAALTCAVILLRQLKQSDFQLLLYFLFFIVVVEIAGWYVPVYLKKYNGWIFNISVPVEYLFYSYLLYKTFKKDINKKVSAIFMILFTAYVLYYSLSGNHDFNYFNSYYLLFGSLALICMSVAYYIEEYFREETGNIWEEPMFWISTGILLFNIGEFSYNLVSTFIITNKLDPVNVLFREVNNKLVILLYILISIGIIKCRKNSKRLKTILPIM